MLASDKLIYQYLEDNADIGGFVGIFPRVMALLIGIGTGDLKQSLTRLTDSGKIMSRTCEEGVERIWLRLYWLQHGEGGKKRNGRKLQLAKALKKSVVFREEFMKEYPHLNDYLKET